MRDTLTLTQIIVLAGAVGLITAPQLRPQQPAGTVDFLNDIEPILRNRCQACHQGDAAPAGLRIDSPAALLKGSTAGKVIVPGNAAESALVRRIKDASGLVMPPSGPRLSVSDISLIETWVNQGAHVPVALVNDFFSEHVQPIFASSCYSCHSGSEPRGGLNLTVRAQALKGGASGPVILPGSSKDSRLMHRVMGSGAESRMPLVGNPLTADQITTLARWIDEGAKWPDAAAVSQVAPPRHWAYVKPVRPPLPPVSDRTWGRNAIDRFILARIEREGLKPSPEASREKIIRRVSLDLIGLPPSPAEVEAFVNDSRPDAYGQLVDRLLASPRYGERWATPWLDLAHYGDSEGWTTDRQREAWPYRDWVIRALNDNMPFDQFTIEQIAGDMLPAPTTDQKIATGFIRSSMMLTEQGTDPEEDVWLAQLDRASTIGSAWLGSTVGCAQCHDHKYDPYTQKHFYQLMAFFNNPVLVKEPPNPKIGYNGFPLAELKLELPTPEQAKKRSELDVELQELRARLDGVTPEFKNREAEWEKALVMAETQWQPLHPDKSVGVNGTTLTISADGWILASGDNPDEETYEIEAASPLQEITALRIEASPHSTLPGGGPGRDYYGNFIVRDVSIEAGLGVQQLTKVAMKEVLSDLPSPPFREDPRFEVKQIWTVDVTRAIPDDLKSPEIQGRPRIQLLLIPEKPLTMRAGEMLRIKLVHQSDVIGVNLGHFRISVTSGPDPKVASGIPAGLRPVINIAPEKRTSAQADRLMAYYRTVDPELEPVRTRITELEERIQDLQIPTTLILAENSEVQRPSAHIRVRGAFLSKGELVEADVPSFLGSLPADAPPNRLGLAKWLINRENPLTARVTVNYFWQTIFGRGIVETADDFGTQGSLPSHPELLDWLASEFMENGWNMKAIQRLMVTSRAYRQASAVTPELLERDPFNVLLARAPRYRVEAEMVRDIAMGASGLLSAKMFGPPVKPYQPDGVWGWFPGSRAATNLWEMSSGEDRYRRGLYIFIRRSVRYPSLTVFDAPSREFCVARRNRSNTPLQALTTLNDPVFFESAQAMAQRITEEGGATNSSRASYGFRLVTARRPNAQELDLLVTAFEKSRKRFEANRQEAQGLVGKPDFELAAWTVISNGLLNLDEALTRE